MIGIDTNVLLRLFLLDDASQRSRAASLIEHHQSSGEVMINAIVLSEFAWTLQRRQKMKRPKIAHYIAEVLTADEFVIEHADAATLALDAYRRGKADFPDYFLAAINQTAGCTATFTFDRDAIDSPFFTDVPEPP